MTLTTEALKVGDTVEVTLDGRTYRAQISRAYSDPSIGLANSRTVFATLVPGAGYSVTLRNDVMAKYAVKRICHGHLLPGPGSHSCSALCSVHSCCL